MRLLVHAVLLTAALGTTAAADKFAHTANVKPTIRDPGKLAPPRPQAEAEPPRPSLGADAILHLQGSVEGLRAQQEGLLKQLIASAPDGDPDKPDYYFRLAEIYAMRQRTHHMLAIQAELAHKDATTEAKATHDALVLAVRTYKTLAETDAFKNYPQMDTALFDYAFTLRAGNYITEARTVFDKLLKEYPGSKYVPEAHLAFADYFFEHHQLDDAAARYRNVLQFPKSSVYWYAMYMLGWVQLNQKDAAGALETFYQVAAGTRDPKQEVMHRAAVKDFVRAYGEIGKPDKALAAFRRVEAPRALDMLATLAELYVEQGKAEPAIVTYRELMIRAPKDARACSWQVGVAREMMIAGSRADQIHEIEQLVKLWASLRDRKALAAAEAGDCRDSAAELSGQLARAYHQEAVKTQNTELFAHADHLYRAYLAAFADAPDAAETRYFHAELLWARAELGDKHARLHAQLWQDAAAAFTGAIEGGELDAKLVKTSADAAMQAWMKVLDIDPLAHVAPPEPSEGDAAYATVPVPKRLSETEQKLLAAYDVYLAHVTDPKDDELVDVKFLEANLYRRNDHYAEAIAGYEDILAHHRDHDAAETAAQLALDSYNRLHQYDKMLALAKRLDADTAFMTGKDHLHGTIATLLRQYARKSAEQLEADGKRTHDLGKLVACGQAYLDVLNSAPLADDADQLLFDAAVCFEEGRSLGAAKELYVRLGATFPKSPLTARSLVRLGNLYAQVARYRDAAQTLEQFAVKYAGEKEAHGAWSDAVVYRKGVGDDDKAIADTTAYIATFGAKRPGEAADAFWSLTAIYEKQGDLDRLARHLRAYLERYGTGPGARADRTVTAYAKLGDALWRASCPVPTVDGTCARVARELVGVRRVKLALRGAAAGPRTHCSDDTSKLDVTIVARDAAKSAAAIAAFGHAIAEWDKRHGAVGGDERGARYFYASAKIGLAERAFEAYLALSIPSSLDFDPRRAAVAAKSKQRLETWVTHKLEVGKATRAQYEAVIALGDGATAIESAARLGQLTQSFAGQLFRAEIPRNLREGPYAEEASDSYCDGLTALGDPFEQDAVKSYEACLVTSTRLGWFSDWSRMCERELGQLDPRDWPTTAELRRTPEVASYVVATEDAPAVR